jgi:hypothetical protein
MVTTTTRKDKQTARRSSDRRRKKLAAIGAVLAAASVVTDSRSVPDPIPMRTSVLTGQLWLDELLEGHPTRFQEQMGMAHHVFHQLSNELQTYCGLSNTKYVSANEQLAIFLHLARTGLSSRMLQERFQRSGDTISK